MQDTQLIEGINDPGIFKAIFILGGPGSGKSHLVKEIFGVNPKIGMSFNGLKYVAADKELELYLKRAKLSLNFNDRKTMSQDNRANVYNISRKAIDNANGRFSRFIDNRLGLIIEGTLVDLEQIEGMMLHLKSLGYDCMAIFVNTPLETALKRNSSRDRVLPDEDVKDIWHTSQFNKDYLADVFGNNMVAIDNKDEEDLRKSKQMVSKVINRFIGRPLMNKFARRWIDDNRYRFVQTESLISTINYAIDCVKSESGNRQLC